MPAENLVCASHSRSRAASRETTPECRATENRKVGVGIGSGRRPPSGARHATCLRTAACWCPSPSPGWWERWEPGERHFPCGVSRRVRRHRGNPGSKPSAPGCLPPAPWTLFGPFRPPGPVNQRAARESRDQRSSGANGHRCRADQHGSASTARACSLARQFATRRNPPSHRTIRPELQPPSRPRQPQKVRNSGRSGSPGGTGLRTASRGREGRFEPRPSDGTLRGCTTATRGQRRASRGAESGEDVYPRATTDINETEIQRPRWLRRGSDDVFGRDIRVSSSARGIITARAGQNLRLLLGL